MKTTFTLLAILCASCSPEPGPVVPKSPMERQMIGLLEKFDRWDDNGDGQLDVSELTYGINSLRGKPQQVSYTAAEVLDFYDTNHDGKISLTEAQAGYKRSEEAAKRVQR
jgi:Ca2+-binding EF-hand superfamily protein